MDVDTSHMHFIINENQDSMTHLSSKSTYHTFVKFLQKIEIIHIVSHTCEVNRKSK